MQTTFSRQNFGRLRVKSFSFDLSNILKGNKYDFSHVMAQNFKTGSWMACSKITGCNQYTRIFWYWSIALRYEFAKSI